MATSLTWQELHNVKLPEFTIANITQYFIARLSKYDNKPSNDYKNVNKHAFPLFKAGHVQSIKIAIEANNVHIKCICLPEMKKGIVYNIILVLDKDSSDIQTASCECPAGSGPYGSCKHIAAVCYALESYSRLQQSESCTSQLQLWNQPRKRHLDPTVVSNIDFAQYEFGKTKRKQSFPVYDPRPSHLRHTSKAEIDTLRSNLVQHKQNAAFLHVLSTSTESNITSYPPAPTSLRVKIMQKLHILPHPLSLNDIYTACKEFIDSIKCSQAQIIDIQTSTRLQSKCQKWFDERKYRITASNFGTIAKRRAPHPPLVKRLLYSTTSTASREALDWGKEHEPDARAQYECSLELGLKTEECGLFVDDSGILGASPDGLVLNSNNKPVRVIEIKCPYSIRNGTVLSACSTSSFFCTAVQGKPTLKKRHNYFFQVQGQMAVTGIYECDFIVWTQIDMSVERIEFDSTFWNSCFPVLRAFYINSLLPEIIYPRYPDNPITYSFSD